ncbi:MAG: hypothetical protein AB2392_12100 [Neobacillus sp.]
MIPASVKVDINEKEILSYIQSKIDEAIHEALIMWDLDLMSKKMCLSKRFIEDTFLRDPRMRQLERRKERGKRIWFYKESLEVIKQIMDEEM